MKKMITLYADEGMIITDGEVFGTTISLAEGKSSEDFYEITKEEYEKLEASSEEEEITE